MAEGVLKIVSNTELQAQEEADALIAAEAEADLQFAEEGLSAFIKQQWNIFRWHRTNLNQEVRYLEALRAYNGEYNPRKISEIKKFGGSDVYSRITSTKCRGATALLRDVYLGGERPWTMEASPVPDVPGEVIEDIEKLVGIEAQQLAQLGEPMSVDAIEMRRKELFDAGKLAQKKEADKQAHMSSQRIEDILMEGGFYRAFKEFLADLPIFPLACIKGPEVRNVMDVKWVDGKLQQTMIPKMFWRRVSPFDLYIDPAASSAAEGDIIEKIKVRRGDLQQCIGLPGYNEENIRSVLNEYEHGLYDWLDDMDSARADQENKEDPQLNRTDMIDTLEYHGAVRGKWLLEYGFTEEQIPDPELDYSVVTWIVGRYVIKVHINPNPKQRHPYYVTNFEKVPGSALGNCLPEIVGDLQDVANASLRSLVNNMSISSGPQVSINEERLSPTTNGDTLYPWKRWRFVSDPMGDTNTPPISFFQPESNAQELLGVYQKMTEIADEVSAIPRYVTGSEKVGGAASTASGLSMLMNNVAKVLQNVAANIDEEVLQPALEDLYTMILLTDPAPFFKGDSQIQVRGVAVAMQKETERMRKLEMLQLTANPIDMSIIGEQGRAAMLRDIADDLGMDGHQIVPSEDDLEAKMKVQRDAMMQQEQEQMAAQAQGDQPGMSRNQTGGHSGEQFDNQHRTAQ